jgi:mRNA interferase YafQ
MRAIERTTRFRRDYKREAKGRHRTTLAGDLSGALRMLVADRPLPGKYRDHSLGGEMAGLPRLPRET